MRVSFVRGLDRNRLMPRVFVWRSISRRSAARIAEHTAISTSFECHSMPRRSADGRGADGRDLRRLIRPGFVHRGSPASLLPSVKDDNGRGWGAIDERQATSGRSQRWHHSAASLDASSSAPGSSKRCVAPRTISSDTVARIRRMA